MENSLCAGFLQSAERFPDKPAIAIGSSSLSYSQLRESAARIAATIRDYSADDRESSLTGIYGHRSFTAFAGVLGALMNGDGYVPLNPVFPASRNVDMAQRARLDWIVVEQPALADFESVLAGMLDPVSVIVPEADDLSHLANRFPTHRFFAAPDLSAADAWRPTHVDSNQIAYLLFTSGSTGKPKGVMVAHRNATSFIQVMVERYKVHENDRFSQTFDLTFDLSVFDMFMAWQVGACVCCPTQQEKLFPSKYIKSHQLTIWFSVPSTAALMMRLRMLKADSYPSIRFSLFCGEALPIELATAFALAAPRSVVENLYGPTELTIACTLYTFDAERINSDSHFGLVPIGEAYPGMLAMIVDEDLKEVSPGEAGELLMTGPQLTPGYWEDPDKTAGAFVIPSGKNVTYYRTGDRVMRSTANAPLVYLGRVDNQIKVQGYRVELGEIEAIMREEANTETAIAIGYPVTDSGAEGIVGFISKQDTDLEALLDAVQYRLPPYMQPTRIYQVPEFPLNSNGKVDRKALMQELDCLGKEK